MPDTAVKTTDLSMVYGDTTALYPLDLDIKTNELFGLIGPDGAGKTTLFRILVTLLIPSQGSASVLGLDTVKQYREIRKNIGYMPGRFSLYMDLSVEENLGFYADAFGTSIQKNYPLIKDIYSQIEPFRKRRAGALSGGMKQKLALSCALIHNPDILFLDEPTTGVDAVSRKEFWGMLKNLINKGKTIVVSTPYMDEASLCDRIALIQGGKVMQTETPENIRKGFQYTLYSVYTDNIYKMILDIRKFNKTHDIQLFGHEAHFTPSEPDFAPEELEHFLRLHHHENVKIKAIEPGIEDCFMELMHKKEQHEAH